MTSPDSRLWRRQSPKLEMMLPRTADSCKRKKPRRVVFGGVGGGGNNSLLMRRLHQKAAMKKLQKSDFQSPKRPGRPRIREFG